MDFNFIDRSSYLEDFKRLIKTVVTTSGKLIKNSKDETDEEKLAGLFYYAYIPLYDLYNYYPFIIRFLSKDSIREFDVFMDEIHSLFFKLYFSEGLYEKSVFLKLLENKFHRKSFLSLAQTAHRTFPELVKKIEEEIQKYFPYNYLLSFRFRNCTYK